MILHVQYLPVNKSSLIRILEFDEIYCILGRLHSYWKINVITKFVNKNWLKLLAVPASIVAQFSKLL